MKKIMSIFSAMLLLTFSMLMTGCEEDIEDLFGPKDKWCEKEFEYESENEDGDSTYVTVYFLYSTKETTVDNLDEPIPAGLTFVAIAESTNEAANIIGENKFVVKTFAEGQKINADGDESEDGKFTVNSTLWNAICILNPSIPESASSKAPGCLTKDTYSQLENLTNFSWKKILAQILVDKLLEE